ncbi:MAG: nitrate reductase associated protein [Chitinophagaceae bacterium]
MKENSVLYPRPWQATENESVNENVFFDFEEDFVEDNVRCIPMIVRFKLDACGIKLKLGEWSKMTIDERNVLSFTKLEDINDLLQYRAYLQQIILNHTGLAATNLAVELNPAWTNTTIVPQVIKEKLDEFDGHLPLHRWRNLNNLQRFVLLKLSRQGHENRNFPIAMKEFGLM